MCVYIYIYIYIYIYTYINNLSGLSGIRRKRKVNYLEKCQRASGE